MKTKFIILSFSIFFMLSCTHDNNSVDLSFTEIGKGFLAGDGAEGIPQSNKVITNTTDWQNLMTQMNTVNNETDEFTETNIDFNTYMVIAVFLEVKPNGWEVQITNVEENTTNIVVSKIDSGYGATVMTQPYHIIKIPITNKPVIFQ